MTLIDTSVWIDHFRHGNAILVNLLEAGEAMTHPMILGELACGALPNRAATLELLRRLPRTGQLEDEYVLHAIEKHGWWSKGIGWVDAHLLTAALVSALPLLTLDRKLAKLARGIG